MSPDATPGFLLVWNPTYATIAAPAAAGAGPVVGDWSTVNRRIAAGDRLYLVRVAVGPRGVVGRGHALDRPHPEADGRHYVPVAWDELSPDAPLLDLAALRAGVPGYNWTPQASGATLRPPALAFLGGALGDGAP